MKAWSVLTTVGLVIVCAVNLVATARRIPAPPRAPLATPANVVLQHQERMAGVRQALQSRGVRGTIGYVADVPAAELAAQLRGMEEFFLTQFALVPWVLDSNAEDCRWIVLNLHTAGAAERVPAGFRVIEDFGDGVLLLEKSQP